MKKITYSRAAEKTLRKLPKNTALRIQSKVMSFAADPASQANNVRSLKGMDGAVRLRVGDWRVVIDNGTVVVVIKIAARGSVY